MQKSKLCLGLMLLGLVLLVAGNSFAAPEPPPTVPDGGSSALMLSAGIAGVAMLRTFLNRKG